MSIVRNYLVLALLAIAGILTSQVNAQNSITIPDNVRKHIPEDAFLLVYIPSMEKLVDAVGKTAATVDPSMGMQAKMMPMMMASEMFKYKDPNQRPELDMSKPGMLAVSAANGAPVVTAMVGIKSTHDGLESADPTMKVESISDKGMVTLSQGPKGKSIDSGASLLKNIPQGQISVAFDQERFVKEFGPMIEMMLAMSTGGMGKAPNKMTAAERASMKQAQQAAKQLKTFMGMFKSWDMSMDFDGGMMDTTVRWIPTDSKSNATGSDDMRNFMHVMIENPPVAGVISKSCLKWMLKFDESGDMSMVPAPLAAMVKKIYANADEITENIKSSAGFSYGLNQNGLWGMQSMKVKNVDKFKSQLANMMMTIQESNMGMTVKDLKMLSPGVGYTFHMDMQKLMESMEMSDMLPSKEMEQLDSVVDAMLGGDVGMQLRYFFKDNHVVAVFGRNGQLIGEVKQLLKSDVDTTSPNVLGSLISTAQGTPTMVLSIDMRSSLDELIRFLNSIPSMSASMEGGPTSMPAGDPIRLDLTCTAMQKGGQCVINFDIGSMAQMMMQVDQEAEEMRQKKAAMAN